MRTIVSGSTDVKAAWTMVAATTHNSVQARCHILGGL